MGSAAIDRKRYYQNPKRKAEVIASVDRLRRRRRAALIWLAGGCCQRCGYDGVALDFHHVGHKRFPMDTRHMTTAWRTVLEEFRRCILLCANCHREIHAEG